MRRLLNRIKSVFLLLSVYLEGVVFFLVLCS